MPSNNNSNCKSNNQSTDFCDLMAAYELNLLDAKSSTEFENHLTNCADCLEEMYAMAPSMTELTAQPGVYAEQAAQHLELDNKASWLTRINKVLFSGPARLLVPVAVAAVLAMLIFLPQGSATKFHSLAIVEAPAYSPLQVRAGQQTPWLPLWNSGMQSYRDSEYQAAAGDLSQAVSIISQQTNAPEEDYTVLDNALFYLGVSQMLDDQILESINTLQIAATSSLRPLQQKSLWNLAQAHLLNEQPQEALTALDRLKNSPVYGAPAQALISDIESLIQE